MPPRYESLSPYLNKKTLFVKEIPEGLNKYDVKSELQRVCPPGTGAICVPVRCSDAGHTCFICILWASAQHPIGRAAGGKCRHC